MQYENTEINGASPQTLMKEGVTLGGTEVDGIAGVLWDVAGGRPIAPRDTDVIYRLYRQELAPSAADAPRPMRGRCFISEPKRPYTIGDRVMLETRDGRHIFGVVRQIREMRTGSVSLILDIEHE